MKNKALAKLPTTIAMIKMMAKIFTTNSLCFFDIALSAL